MVINMKHRNVIQYKECELIYVNIYYIKHSFESFPHATNIMNIE